MTNSKSTKRALVSSALAVFLCVAMLIGTTFAWFTDTASTSVNKIQAGTLKIALEKWDGEKWVDAEGETLDFVKAEGAAADEAILWEPGCTYNLPKLRIRNDGNLALKYKVVITGINGDAKLNEVIDWTIGDVAQGTEQKLAVGAANEFTISGTMKKTAGNAYQGLSIDGIAITVVATQDAVEYDSNDNQYDKDAVVVYHHDAGNDNYPYIFASFGRDTLTSTVVDSNYSWNNLYSENGYSANGHNVISLCQNTGDEAAFTDCIFLCDVGNVYSAEHGKLTFKDCTFYGWVHFGDPTGATILFENCTFTSSSDVKIGTDAVSVTFKNCTFEEKQTIVDTATMNAEYSYAGECGRIMLWSDTTFENCTVAREVYKGEDVTVTGELPTLVSTAAELSTAMHKGGNILLLNDIRVESWTSVRVDTANAYQPIANSISIDGNGHSISGLTSSLLGYNPAQYIEIKNLTIKNSNIVSNETGNNANCGAFVAYVDGGVFSFKMSNCHAINVNVTANNSGAYGAGALVGYEGITASNGVFSIVDCTVTGGSVTNTNGSAAAIVGMCYTNANSAIISGCSVSGVTVTGEAANKQGAIAGTICSGGGSLEIANCTYTGNAYGRAVDATVNVH